MWQISVLSESRIAIVTTKGYSPRIFNGNYGEDDTYGTMEIQGTQSAI